MFSDIFKKEISDLDGPLYTRLMQIFPNCPKFKLLYQASRDGFSTTDFHEKCDKIPNTLTIIKHTQHVITHRTAYHNSPDTYIHNHKHA